MKALVISHTYVAEDNRSKWEQLGLAGKVDIELLLPHRWPSWEQDYRPKVQERRGFRVRKAYACRVGREDQYFFPNPFGLGLKKGAFDILHVEQGTTAAVYAQALREKGRCSKSTKACFFTWINWEAPLRWPWTRFEEYNLRQSEGAIGGNSEAVDLLRKHGFRGKTAVIPQLGVDPDIYQSSPNVPLQNMLNTEGPVVGFVGRLVEEKGVRLLWESVARLSEPATLLLLGSGPLGDEIRSKFKPWVNWMERGQRPREKGFEIFELGACCKLVWVPAVPHEDVVRYLQAMDLLVLPSYTIPTWKEQFGHVLIEAMSCEVPVIGSASGGIPEAIGDAGFVFKEKDSEDLFEKLAGLTRSSELRQSYGKKGRLRVLERFTHQKIGEATFEFWKTL
jgi:glycosyltransferase involved in cell wall biosynthesis